MLPITPEWKEGSMSDLIETAPRMDLSVQDIEHLVEELRAYHAIYSPLFQRREQREAAHASLQGVLATLPRKSIEPMGLAVEGGGPHGGAGTRGFRMVRQRDDWRQVGQQREREGGGRGGGRGGVGGV